jgi:Ca2+-binding EF-hand superfamily protein
LINFQAREIAHLKSLYKEEIAHFKCVSVEQFMDILREIGERCSKTWITKLFRGFAGNDKELKSWKHFMEVINHIKKDRGGGIDVKLSTLDKLINFFRRRNVVSLLESKSEKMGDW